MNYRSYGVNLWTKSRNLKLMCDVMRSYEVKETRFFKRPNVGFIELQCN